MKQSCIEPTTIVENENKEDEVKADGEQGESKFDEPAKKISEITANVECEDELKIKHEEDKERKDDSEIGEANEHVLERSEFSANETEKKLEEESSEIPKIKNENSINDAKLTKMDSKLESQVSIEDNCIEFYSKKPLNDEQIELIQFYVLNPKRSGGGDYKKFLSSRSKRLFRVEFKKPPTKIFKKNVCKKDECFFI